MRVRVIKVIRSRTAACFFEHSRLKVFLTVSEIYNEQVAVEYRERCQIRVC